MELGFYKGTVDFEPSAATFNLTSSGNFDNWDVFVLKLNLAVGINNIPSLNSVLVFPNPNQGQVNIDFGSIYDASIKVYTTEGRLVLQQNNIHERTYRFKLDKSAGIYFVEILAKGESKMFKLIKN